MDTLAEDNMIEILKTLQYEDVRSFCTANQQFQKFCSSERAKEIVLQLYSAYKIRQLVYEMQLYHIPFGIIFADEKSDIWDLVRRKNKTNEELSYITLLFNNVFKFIRDHPQYHDDIILGLEKSPILREYDHVVIQPNTTDNIKIKEIIRLLNVSGAGSRVLLNILSNIARDWKLHYNILDSTREQYLLTDPEGVAILEDELAYQKEVFKKKGLYPAKIHDAFIGNILQ